MTSFNAQTIALEGLNIIEASAGTGKTYTLAELYLRLLLEPGQSGQSLSVEQILVVTYTRAATEELRDRLRQKLVDARKELLKDPSDRSFLQNMTDTEQCRQASQKLMLAIQSFDQAAIFTIHSFCQRVLSDYAFESGLRFELELIGDDLSLLQSATDDFWRRHVAVADSAFVSYLLSKNESPETLLASIRSLVGKPYIETIPVALLDVNESLDQIKKQFAHAQLIWLEEQQEILDTFNNKALLNGNKYRAASVKKWLDLLANMMSLPASPARVFDGFERFSRSVLNSALKKGQGLPELRFWSVCESLSESYQQLELAQESQLQGLRVALLAFLRESLPQQKRQQQVQSYDDLLINLEHALHGEQGDHLVENCRQQYQAALIDEFQDTDPMQYASFNRIYANSGLATFLVGDPKQAIYSFRGADIFTYLQAKSQADKEYTLSTNWRSHHHLVTAVNTLFNRCSNPFLEEDIPFHPVAAQRQESPALRVSNTETTALQLLWADSEKAMAKKELTAIAAEVTSDEIARLLNSSQQGDAVLGDETCEQSRPLSGGDIAVLVRNHRQANEIQQRLQQRGINSVQQGRENVFLSKEALILQRVLLAIAQPNNEARITAALATPLWGLNAAELLALQYDEEKWIEQTELFYEYHQLWLKHGFMRVFRQFMTAVSVQQRLLKHRDGDRQLTNLNHLAELIQIQCQHSEGMEAVLYYLSDHIQSADGNDEQAQLRLESDEQLVKIITIHKSKGLEYPIVFCPFLWDVNLRADKDAVITFHEPASKQAYAAFSEPALSRAAELVIMNERAEDLRLLYVALTRAREQCYIVWGNVKGRSDGQHVSDSALFSLLHPTLTELNSELMREEIHRLALESENTISVDTIRQQEVINYSGANELKTNLSARNVKRKLAKPWRMASFSSLAHGHDAEVADYDYSTSLLRVEKVKAASRIDNDRFSFPRGAQAGTCLHALFEYWDFTSQDEQAKQQLVSRTLLQYGFDEKWVPVACQWLSEVLDTPLNDMGLSLGQLQHQQRLDELSFYFPIANLSVDRLKAALLPVLSEDSPLREVIQRLNFSALSGFMKGFVDLVFEDNGQYYIVDYKSNHLGYEAEEYQAERLNNAMVSHDYPLQYLIYSLALHRYLRLRLTDYDPEHHLGGVYYLFIRGMKAEWGSAGIFHDRLSTTLLDAFDQCLQGISHE